MKKIICSLAIGIILITLPGCGETNTPTKVTPTNASTTAPIPKKETFKVGDTFKLGDLQYKVNGIRTTSGSNEFMKPKDGNTFLLIDITIENQGSSDATISSMLSFNLRDKDGRSQNISIEALNDARGKLDGSISPGRKITGELGYEISKGTQSFELEIKNDLLSNGTAIVGFDVK